MGHECEHKCWSCGSAEVLTLERIAVALERIAQAAETQAAAAAQHDGLWGNALRAGGLR